MAKRLSQQHPNVGGHAIRLSVRGLLVGAVVILSMACANNQKSPTTRPLTMEERQAQMLADPFGYKSDTPNADISGGDLTHFDKDAFKKDLDHVFNP